MAAVLGLPAIELQVMLNEFGLSRLDLVNFNSTNQTVIAGDSDAIYLAEKQLTEQGIQCIVLNVCVPFHSRYMNKAQEEFATFLHEFTFADPEIPVIANATARRYPPGQVAQLLVQQIANPVKWMQSIQYLMGFGNFDYEEIGADSSRIGGNVLGKLVDDIRSHSHFLDKHTEVLATDARENCRYILPNIPPVVAPPSEIYTLDWDAKHLGSSVFRERYGTQYAYVAGAMYRAIASEALVIQMSQAGLLSYFGSGGLSLQRIENAIQTIQARLGVDSLYGMNLLADYVDPELELATVQLYLKYGVRNIEAAAYMQITPAIVQFRLSGLSRDIQGYIQCAHHILAKISRLEVAQAFMSPPPAEIVAMLYQKGAITAEQAELAQYIPVSDDICAEADSGGHTDAGIPTILLPAILQLRQSIIEKYHYQVPPCVGLAGGIGTPMAAAAAFVMGADFILTGSINQCTVESGSSALVKEMLQQASIHDMAYAPAGDMFEMGSRVQVLRKGLLFPPRANKLYAYYLQYDSLEDLPTAVQSQLEDCYFKCSLAEVWQETLYHLQASGRTQDIAKAQVNAKYRMSLVFRWYFSYSTQLAFSGLPDDKTNYQVHTGPALGAFNQWVQGTELAVWTQRHVDLIAMKLLHATANQLTSMLNIGCDAREGMRS
ncbi:PfaD family polyunsaturated fatty acid/polyketide biosynthesis protein [Yersinia kristensenii]|uniref:PfaD family polyunsaturated fatty acid/polyketide biosynthesis protein n=1 Tax=Yersinia kristensenii TaxID=28152 RepID=UPI0001A54A2E|nr:PfaD family polyunsaturated fatty acid/polyketide biosynthesis protein [Yersinia kristensenii]EEP93154.1 Malonyl CoA [acyl-carrier-protein] transacylase [Yersinia kristensenii ATCC 33638]EEP93406.1 Malonyl CoA [acyl-carrier-protein] transacylase [Yersinia kristensenii ATCC 33638]PEH55690.1 Malonyl CoA [Yersinia kristensenii]SUP69628.1 putative acyl transferase [Yersinia kristensenii]